MSERLPCWPEYTPAPGMPLVALVVPFKMTDAPSLINGSRY